MITSLMIENFKCFPALRLPIGKLTVLTGYNASGKSTAIQPLLLLAQGLGSSPHPTVLSLNGPLVRLGSVADVVSATTETSDLQFKVSSSAGVASWRLLATAGDRSLGVPDGGEESDEAIVNRLRRLVYISAVREGTAEAFPIPDDNSLRLGDVGVDGRYAAYWYDKIVDETVVELRRNPGESATSVRKQLDAWLSTLFPSAQANVQLIPQVSLLSLQFRLAEFGPWHRPANVGYGLTYVFPILVALLAAGDAAVLVIDSPEAHLHPSAQSQMGRLLAHFATAGVQIIVETHSDHLLNGVRLGVRDSVIRAEDVQIHFFSGASETGTGVITPAVDSGGRLDTWPEGFFDQTEKDLSRLSGWG